MKVDAFTARPGKPIPIHSSWTAPSGFYARFGKRIFDLVGAILLLPIAAPVIVAFWIMVRVTGPSGFFAHERIGRNGRLFKCWKLRTMVPDAEARLKKQLNSCDKTRAEWNSNFKLEKDPRITRMGHFLRRSSLDELPQIWNVLCGDMSLVGPRPVVMDELAQYGEYQALYLSCRPGVTGAWQTSGRNDISYQERVEMDADYIRKMALMHDFGIVLKTALVVAKATGK